MYTAIFLLLVAMVACLHVAACGISGRTLKHKRARLQRDLMAVLAAVTFLLVFSYAVASSEVLTDFRPMPPRMLLFVFPHLIAAAGIGLSAYGKRLADGLPVWAIVGSQAFRFPLELVLHGWYLQGLLPVQMTFAGYNFDIVTGLTAIPVAWLAWRGKLTRTVLLGWNAIGLALLVNIVTIAVLSMPGPARMFANEPANTLVAEAPYVWLPVVLVTAALLGHIVVFRTPLAKGTKIP